MSTVIQIVTRTTQPRMQSIEKGITMHSHGLTKRTKEHKEEQIVYLSKKPIKELWEKAGHITAEQKHTFNKYVKATKCHDYKEIEVLEKHSAELAELEHDIKEAIRRK